MNFVIVYRRYYNTPQDFKIMSAGYKTLEEAKEARAVSGDLVCHNGSLLTVDSEKWLWEWEKKQEDCYARKAIRHDWNGSCLGYPTRTDCALQDELAIEA